MEKSEMTKEEALQNFLLDIECLNLFSFASKYCCYHNRNLYERDDYSILDTVLKEYLPRYFDDITRGQIQKWQDSFNYQAYNDYISKNWTSMV